MRSEDSLAVVFWRRRASRALAATAGGLVLGALTSCDAASLACHDRCAEGVEVFVLTSWGMTDDDGGPAQPLVDEARADHGVADVHMIPHRTKPDLMAIVEAWMLGEEDELMTLAPATWPADNQFDAFLANGGRDVLRWTPCGGSDGADKLLRLDGRYQDRDFRDRFAPPVLAGVECCPPDSDCRDSGLYAVPVGRHQVNNIVYNPTRFAPCNGEPVTNADQFVELLRCLSKDERRVISLPTDLDERGRAAQYLIENLLLLVAGPERYQKYWRGEQWVDGDAAGAPGREALRAKLDALVQEIKPYVNGCRFTDCDAPDTLELAADEVALGDAAFMVVPDWFKSAARLRAEALVAEMKPAEVDGGDFPGTSSTVVFATDVFAIPAHANVEAGLRWVDALLDTEAQKEFALHKGAKAALAPVTPGDIPSLEALLPPNVKIESLRATLDAWMAGNLPDTPLFQRIEQHFAEAEAPAVSSVAACNEGSCGGL
jgi:hypothetical protein